MTTTIPVTVNVPPERLACLICTACEQGCGYWLRWERDDPPSAALAADAPAWARELHDYAIPLLGGAIHFRELDGDRESPLTPRVLDRAAIDRGLALMAEKHPRHFGDLLSENDDAETADVFMQLALLGEVRYG